MNDGRVSDRYALLNQYIARCLADAVGVFKFQSLPLRFTGEHPQGNAAEHGLKGATGETVSGTAPIHLILARQSGPVLGKAIQHLSRGRILGHQGHRPGHIPHAPNEYNVGIEALQQALQSLEVGSLAGLSFGEEGDAVLQGRQVHFQIQPATDSICFDRGIAGAMHAGQDKGLMTS